MKDENHINKTWHYHKKKKKNPGKVKIQHILECIFQPQEGFFFSSLSQMSLSYHAPLFPSTAVVVGCDTLPFPLEDSRDANNSVVIDLQVLLAVIFPPVLIPHGPFAHIKNHLANFPPLRSSVLYLFDLIDFEGAQNLWGSRFCKSHWQWLI